MDEELINELITGVYNEIYTPYNLPPFLYEFTFKEIESRVQFGFGESDGVPALEERAANYRQNISRFSGAKTFQEVNELSKGVFTETGKKMPFAEFKRQALKVDSEYNVNWLKTEQDTAFLQAQNARKWIKADQQKDVFPFLEYITVGDDRVRPSHRNLNGFKARVDDPIWNKIHPANGWRCRCTVIQHEAIALTQEADRVEKTRLILDDFKKDAEFSHNPGKVDYIFKETGKGKHDYFKVPREFSEDLKRNFNLGFL